jgi:hypothetical protein
MDVVFTQYRQFDGLKARYNLFTLFFSRGKSNYLDLERIAHDPGEL